MPWSVAFHAIGESFYPSQIDYAFSRSHDPGLSPNGRQQVGSATIEVPASIPNEDRIKYLVNLVLPLMPSILQAGADEYYLNIGRFYSTQCNEELSAEEIAFIARLNCGLIYSAYQVSEEEELDLEQKLGGY